MTCLHDMGFSVAGFGCKGGLRSFRTQDACKLGASDIMQSGSRLFGFHAVGLTSEGVAASEIW